MPHTPTTFRHITRNSLWLLLARVGSQIVMLLFTVLVARRLGEAGLGQYAFIAAVLFVGNVFTTFGMDTYLMREIARAEQTPFAPIGRALQLQLILSAFFVGLIWLGAGWLPNQTAVSATALRITQLALIPLAFTTAFSAALRAHEHMGAVMWINLETAIFQTGGAFLLFQMSGNLVGLAWVLVAAQVGTAILAALFCFRELSDFTIQWPRLTIDRMWQTAVSGAALAFLMVLAVIYQRTGIFVLSLIAGDAATGLFSAAARLVEAAKMVPYAIFGALFPLMARTQQAGSTQATRTGFWASLTYTLLAAFGLTLIAPWIIPALFGAAYQPAVATLRLLAWSLVPFAFTLRFSFELVAQQQERKVLIVAFWALVSTAVFTLIATRTFGQTGTAAAIVTGETLQAVLLFAVRPKNKSGTP